MQQQSSLNGSTKETIRRTLATSLKGQPLLGYCIYWSFSEMKTTHEKFKSLVESVGMPVEIAPETRAKSAVSKALEAYVGATKGGKLRDKVIDDKEKTLWVIVQRAVDAAAQDVNYETETRVTFDKKKWSGKSSILECVTIDGAAEVQQALIEKIQDFATAYTSDQIRASILLFVHRHCQGITVRENGGLYFLPAMHEAGYNQLKKLFAELNKISTCSVDVIPVADDAEAAASMWKALTGDVRAQMADMLKDIESLRKNPSEKTIDIKMKHFHDLKTKIQMYEVLLSSTAVDLVQELADVEAAFSAKINS